MPGATGCCGPSPAAPTRCRSCMASPASAASTNGRCPGCRALPDRPRCASAMPRPASCSSMSMARSPMLWLWRARAGSAPCRAASISTTSWLEHLARIWHQPDNGIWEVRGKPQHFTHSKVMAWVAFRRAADSPDLDRAARRHWGRLADRIHREICRNALDPRGGHFVQAYGSRRLDASLLLLAIVGFLPPRGSAPRQDGGGDRAPAPGRWAGPAL